MTVKNSNVLKHLAIIPDGNRRWAKKHNLPFWHGHQKGAEKFKEVLQTALEENISYTTIWIASKDNLKKRTKQEVNYLYRLFTKNFQKLLEDKKIHQNKVKVSILGEWSKIVPQKLHKTITKLINSTKSYQDYHLTFLLAYDGIGEMLQAFQSVALAKNFTKKLNYDSVKSLLLTSALPAVDLVIRTGGEPHNSAGFMMWHTAYSQYYFTNTLWPAFGKEEMLYAIKDFQNRGRRFGA